MRLNLSTAGQVSVGTPEVDGAELYTTSGGIHRETFAHLKECSSRLWPEVRMRVMRAVNHTWWRSGAESSDGSRAGGLWHHSHWSSLHSLCLCLTAVHTCVRASPSSPWGALIPLGLIRSCRTARMGTAQTCLPRLSTYSALKLGSKDGIGHVLWWSAR